MNQNHKRAPMARSTKLLLWAALMFVLAGASIIGMDIGKVFNGLLFAVLMLAGLFFGFWAQRVMRRDIK